jgi:hypothetical protein
MPPSMRRSWRRGRKIVVALSVLAAMLFAVGCGESAHSSASEVAVTARSYASAKSLLAAMDANGAACSAVDFISSSVTGVVGQWVDCSGASSGDTALGVFTDHADAVAYADQMVSLAQGVGGTPTDVVVGPDWAVNTSSLAFAKKVVKAIGGQVTSSSSATASAGAGSGSPAPGSGGSPAAGLSAGDQQFASDMQSTFNFGSSVQEADIASFGEQVCADLQTGASIASEVPTVQQDWTNTAPGDAIQMILLAEKDICPSEQSAQTVTYAVTGSYADVTYGPAGSDDQGTVPMSVTQPLGSPQYYAINAQLQGGGSVSCQIKVDGVTIASASASGGYNIADCEIDQNSLSGGWENTNSAG